MIRRSDGALQDRTVDPIVPSMISTRLRACENRNDVLEIVSEVDDVNAARENLKKRFEFTEAQTIAITDSRMRAYTKIEHQRLIDEYSELFNMVAVLEERRTALEAKLK